MGDWLAGLQKNQDVIFVVAVIAIMFTIFVPVPPFLLDFLLVASITISVLTLLTVIYVREPIKFSVFPSVLLLSTAYRLALNVATTRQILGNAQKDGIYAAGHVVASFGNFVAGAEPLVGFIIFLILILVNFVVISKGATRVSEVAARFTLDAMPGKQMAIDADLNAGLIKETEARKRREQIAREADFYGAMDGATKFVRGDAIAGILITVINILGGFILGVAKFGMPFSKALTTYTILTIGDGLVSQIPALIVSLGAGLIVTRATAESNLGREFIGQLVFGEKRTLLIGASFLGILMVTAFFGSGMPWPPIALVAGGLLVLFVSMGRQEKVQEADEVRRKDREAAVVKPERVEPLLHVDPMELEIGYGLIRLVDPAQGGSFMERVSRIRREMAVNLGLVVPPIRIRDNMQLEPNQYLIKIRGTEVARGSMFAEQFLAMDAGAAGGAIDGVRTTEPAFGLTAYWIPEAQKQRAEALGYTVVDATTVLATHITEVIKRNAEQLLTREDVHNLVKTLKESSPSLVEEVIPTLLKPGEIQKILQNLLRENVPIRDLGTIVETVAEYASRSRDPEVLTEYARNALARTITQQHLEKDGRLYVLTLDPRLEDQIKNATERTEHASRLTLNPPTVNRIVQQMTREVEKVITAGHTPAILCAPQVRVQVKRLADLVQPGIAVLSYNEVLSDAKVEALGMIALTEAVAAA